MISLSTFITMSTGKRLAKRSIIGTRVCAPGEDRKYYSGVIHAVKTPNCDTFGSNISSETRYSVRFDALPNNKRLLSVREYRETELIGPGFQTVSGIALLSGQKVYLTYNGREVTGEVTSHDPQLDEVHVSIVPPGHEDPMELRKRLEDIRLLESRKSARLMDQDTDFARLADMAGDRKRPSSHSIDVPAVHGSRKRRPSSSQDDAKELDPDVMTDCTAALVLMSLSCSPNSPLVHAMSWPDRRLSPSPSSDVYSWRSSTPSPPLSEGGSSTSAFWAQLATDEGIGMEDFDELPRKRKAGRMVFQCTFPGCLVITTTCAAIESHVRKTHLGLSDGPTSNHEEEFYYTEVALGLHASSPPTLSHRDMARPPHEDPEYQKQLKLGQNHAGPINIPSRNLGWGSATTSPSSPQKYLKLSPRSGNLLQSGMPTLSLSAPNKLPGSPTRKMRGDTKKCRKVYGMEHREQWCTQCKWKKACTRFGD